MKFINKSLLTQTDGFIIQAVNCRGVMGSGLAFQIRQRYPVVYVNYLDHIYEKTKIDRKYKPPFFHHTQDCKSLLGDFTVLSIDGLSICCIFTQLNFGRDKDVMYTSLDAVYYSLRNVNSFLDENHFNEVIKMPKICSGLGGAPWPVIQELIQYCLPNKDIEIYIP